MGYSDSSRERPVRRGLFRLVLLAFVAGAATPAGAADDVYQKPSAFIREAFDGELPPAAAVELTSADQAAIKASLGQSIDVKRIRFWTKGGRTVWILNEIGKVKPITAGFVVAKGRIERVKVLVYRESHGWEVKEKFFTRQFEDAALEDGRKLSKPIDNIAGATLSVRAVTRMAELALYLEGKRTTK